MIDLDALTGLADSMLKIGEPGGVDERKAREAATALLECREEIKREREEARNISMLKDADRMRLLTRAEAAEQRCRELEQDAERFSSMHKWIAAIIWKKEADLPTIGHLDNGFTIDDLRVWIDAARREGK